ncbi:MAG: branched-chain amino acid ABC transporter permease [Rhodobacteraceae bacterium]|nr:branched-chain amino acid ABC transporter permease [Paracoccaceae bacterium]
MKDAAAPLAAPHADAAGPLRRAAPALVLFAFLALIPALAEVWGGGYLTSLAMRAMILALAASALDLLIGRAGLVSFGHAAYVGLGAYVTGIFITEGMASVALILPAVIISCALFAFITGAISLRTSGVSFIMITLAFGQMLYFGASSLSAYGADDGLTLWERADVFGTGLLYDNLGLFYTLLLTLIAAHVAASALAASRFGRVLIGAKQNAERVAAMGFDVFRYRLAAYVIAGVVAGIAGFFLANQAEFVSPAYMSWQRSGDLIIIVVLGGMGTRSGALLGAIAFVALEEGLSSLTHDWRLIFGPLLILAALTAKRGIAGLVDAPEARR